MLKQNKINYILVSLSSILLLNSITFVFSEDTYSQKEKLLLKQFRELVKDGFTKDYMSEDKYLIRFLRAGKLDLKRSVDLMQDNFKWRKENGIDNISLDPKRWTKWHQAFPYYFTHARDGRPTATTGLKDLDFRKIVIAGRRDELRNYIRYGIELATEKLHNHSRVTGQEWVGLHVLFNMGGFNLRTHGCIACMASLTDLLIHTESHYPLLQYTFNIVNSPRIIQNLYEVVKPFLGQYTQNSVGIYGFDQTEWGPLLDKMFTKDQLMKEFGGTATNSTI